jgi:hypothetical protein
MVELYWQGKTNFPPELSGNTTSTHLVANQEEPGNINDEFGLQNIYIHTTKWLFTCRKILQHGADGFTSPAKEGMLRIFITLKKIHCLGQVLTRKP